MKKIACIAALLSVLLSALLWAGCAPPAPREEETFVRVVVVENGGPFTPERRVYDVARGEDLVLRLYFLILQPNSPRVHLWYVKLQGKNCSNKL